MISKRIASIFHRGSRTYFYSSLFFPAEVREDVFRLYAFVRVADDFVDQVPQDIAGFEAFLERYGGASHGEHTGDEVVDGFVELAQRKGFDASWTDSFLTAMLQDVTKSEYRTLAEVEDYMYGSAEVIGLMMGRILDLPEAAFPTAQRLGKAMQYLNFLRDVDHDKYLGRTYIPREVLERYGLADASRAEATSHPEAFAAMMRHELRRYKGWQAAAERGYRFLPRRYRIPIKTAADLYLWTAHQIEVDPQRVFEEIVKPPIPRIVALLARNAASAARRPQESGYSTSIDTVKSSAG